MYTSVPTRGDAIECYWEFTKASPDLMVKARRAKGYDSVCACGPDQDCHAYTLLATRMPAGTTRGNSHALRINPASDRATAVPSRLHSPVGRMLRFFILIQ